MAWWSPDAVGGIEHTKSASIVGETGFWIGVSIGPGCGDSYTKREPGTSCGGRSVSCPVGSSIAGVCAWSCGYCR